MFQQLFALVVFIGFHTFAHASGAPATLFTDGRWSGGTGTAPDSAGVQECWADTTFSDGTTLTLAKQSDGNWHLRLSNPDWQLPAAHRFDMVALVDFYPRVRFDAETKNQTSLEIASLEQKSLLVD